MTRPVQITQAAIARAIRAARDAGMDIAEVQVTAAGDVRIIPVGQAAHAGDDFDKWMEANDAAKGHTHHSNPAV